MRTETRDRGLNGNRRSRRAGGALAAAAALLLAAPSSALASNPTPLIEMAAPGGTGYSYTLSKQEADLAAELYGFTYTLESRGAIWTQPFERSFPLYILKKRNAESFIPTISESERASLVGSGEFVDPVIIGYVLGVGQDPGPGYSLLWRYSSNGRWRLALDSQRPAFDAAGWNLDGAAGYASLCNTEIGGCAAQQAGPPAESCSASEPTKDYRLRVKARKAGRKGGNGGASRAATVRYGRELVVRGRLTGPDEKPVGGAAICVGSRVAIAGAEERTRATVATDANGRFVYRTEAGPSQRLSFVFTAGASVARDSLSVRVPAPISLHLSPPVLHADRQKLRLRGRLRGVPRPPGTLVALQSRRPERWQTFGNARIDEHGRFSFAYRFTRFEGTALFKFRALMPAQRGSPFATGASKVSRIKVIGGG